MGYLGCHVASPGNASHTFLAARCGAVTISMNISLLLHYVQLSFILQNYYNEAVVFLSS